jgi:hypothetical protein
MIATSPEALHHLWTESVNLGDPNALTALCESEAALVVQPGQIVDGQTAIRAPERNRRGRRTR